MTRVGVIEDERGLASMIAEMLSWNKLIVEEPINNLAQVPRLCEELLEETIPEERIIVVVDGTFINQGTLDSDAGVKAGKLIREKLPYAIVIRFSTEDVRREEDKESYDFFIPKTGSTQSVHELIAQIKRITP